MRYSLVLIVVVMFSSIVDAQVSVNLNVDRQPVGPTGYDHVEYYYLPDIETYYYVPQRRFYYLEKGQWVNGSSLPARYHGYDFYNSYKVVVNEPSPYRHHETYKVKYVEYKGRHDQQSIRDSHDSKYFVNAHHPEHNNWVKEHNNDHGNRNGKDKSRGNKSGKK